MKRKDAAPRGRERTERGPARGRSDNRPSHTRTDGRRGGYSENRGRSSGPGRSAGGNRPRRDDDDRGYRGDHGDRPRRNDDRRDFRGDRPRRDDERGGYRGDRPRRDDNRGNFRGDRPRRDDDRGNYRGDRPRRDDSRGNYRDDRPRRDEGPRDYRGSKPRHFDGPDNHKNERSGPGGREQRPFEFDPDKRPPRQETVYAETAPRIRTFSRAKPPEGSWEEVAGWYDEHLGTEDTHHNQILWPGVEEIFHGARKGSVLDVGCGTGFFSLRLQQAGWDVTGLDIAPAMVAQAKEQAPRSMRWVVDDAQRMTKVKGSFDAALSVLAAQNMPDAARMIGHVSEHLKREGIFVLVTLHPAFRIPKHTAWAYDDDREIQLREVWHYNTPRKIKIEMHPGQEDSVYTETYHRPMSYYVNAMAEAGLPVVQMHEWASNRFSQAGPRARMENTARKQIPLFVALVGKKY